MELTTQAIQAKALADNLISSSQIKGFENGHWWFWADTDPRGDAPQFQATYCLKCGNYIISNTLDFPLPHSISCVCQQDDASVATIATINTHLEWDDEFYDDAYWQQVEDDWQREIDFREGRRQFIHHWSGF
jgi:hypothetical protein